MGIEKKCLSTGRIYRVYAPDDLSKKWFVSIHDSKGKRIKRKYGKINRLDSKEKRTDAAIDLINELIIDPGIVKINQSLEETIFGWINSQKLRPKSKRTYESIARAFIDFMGDRTPNQKNVDEFMMSVRLNKYETTYNNYLRQIKRFLLIAGYPGLMDKYSKVKERRRPARFFQRHQIELLKEAMRDTDLLHFCEFQYYCFIRPKEIRNLRAQNIMLDSEQILINGDFSKNGKTEYVAIPKPFVMKLQYIRDLQPNDLIFHQTRDRTKIIGENTMWYKHKLILDKFNFGSGYSLYSWKHTGAVNFIKNGGHVKQLQIQLRHHSLDQVNEYLRQMGLSDLGDLRDNFPKM